MRLGADPEVFLCTLKGKYISVINRVGGTKENPLQIKNLAPGFTVQEDNVALEFGIPPAENKKQFVSNIRAVIEASLPLVKTSVPLKFSHLSCVVFPKRELKHPAANIFGCEPDFNAWTKEENPRPIPLSPFIRSAGGHVHMETVENPISIVKAMDLLIAVPAVLIDNGIKRKHLYGKAGAFRYKPYGVEYRTPSNFWIFKEELVGWIWDQSYKALNYVASGIDLNGLARQIQTCINTNDKTMAEKLITRFSINLPKGYR